MGEFLDIPFSKPCRRTEVLNHPEYYPLRERMLAFLEEQDHAHSAQAKVEKLEINLPAKLPLMEETQSYHASLLAHAAIAD